jgi:hypothetical protein
MSNTKKEKTDIVENKVERKPLAESLREWVASLHLGKPQAVMAAVSVVVMLAAFLIFNNLSVSMFINQMGFTIFHNPILCLIRQ